MNGNAAHKKKPCRLNKIHPLFFPKYQIYSQLATMLCSEQNKCWKEWCGTCYQKQEECAFSLSLRQSDWSKVKQWVLWLSEEIKPKSVHPSDHYITLEVAPILFAFPILWSAWSESVHRALGMIHLFPDQTQSPYVPKRRDPHFDPPTPLKLPSPLPGSQVSPSTPTSSSP